MGSYLWKYKWYVGTTNVGTTNVGTTNVSPIRLNTPINIHFISLNKEWILTSFKEQNRSYLSLYISNW